MERPPSDHIGVRNHAAVVNVGYAEGCNAAGLARATARRHGVRHPVLDALARDDQVEAVSEHRPCGMRWAVLRPTSDSGD